MLLLKTLSVRTRSVWNGSCGSDWGFVGFGHVRICVRVRLIAT